MGEQTEAFKTSRKREAIGLTAKPKKEEYRTQGLRMRADLLERLKDAVIQATIIRGKKVTLTDLTNEMIEDILAKLNRESGK